MTDKPTDSYTEQYYIADAEARRWKHKYEGLSQALEAMVASWAERAGAKCRPPVE